MNTKAEKKNYVVFNIRGIIAFLFTIFPLPGLFIFRDLWMIIICIAFPIFAYSLVTHLHIRIIFIKNGYVSVSKELTPFSKLQHYFKIETNDIASMSFEYVRGDSEGHKYDYENSVFIRNGRLNCLRFTIKRSEIKRIILEGFTYHQYNKIKAVLLANNPYIQIENEPSNLRDKKKDY